jgi:hypothetical protein
LSGGKVFDCVLAVTTKENSVDKIYTENVGDSEFYDFLEKKIFKQLSFFIVFGV